jgi:hypothetical protein
MAWAIHGEAMSQLDFLNLARSCGVTISSDFAQVFTITGCGV